MVLISCGAPEPEAPWPTVLPGALTSPPRELPLDTEAATVLVRNGQFEYLRYTIQGGRVRLRVRTLGGPYTMTVDRYVATPQQLAKDDVTLIEFIANDPGRLTMRIEETGAIATLTIRGPTAR